jgi:hypothetical protein
MSRGRSLDLYRMLLLSGSFALLTARRGQARAGQSSNPTLIELSGDFIGCLAQMKNYFGTPLEQPTAGISRPAAGCVFRGTPELDVKN